MYMYMVGKVYTLFRYVHTVQIHVIPKDSPISTQYINNGNFQIGINLADP